MRRIDDVAAAFEVLGRTKEWDGLLRVFHVNPRGLPKTVLDAPLFPSVFGSLSSSQQLQESFARAASILRAVNSRLHLMIDETVWAASLEQVRPCETTPTT